MTAPSAEQIAKVQRIGNLVANLAHPDDDHCENDLEDEAHDLLRELRAYLSSDWEAEAKELQARLMTLTADHTVLADENQKLAHSATALGHRWRQTAEQLKVAELALAEKDAKIAFILSDPIRQQLAEAQADRDQHLTRANEEIARRERAQIAYTQSEQKRLVLIDALASLTEEREELLHQIESDNYARGLEAKIVALTAAHERVMTAIEEFRQTRGRHEGDHHYNQFTTCSLCEEAYVRAEARLDEALASPEGTPPHGSPG